MSGGVRLGPAFLHSADQMFRCKFQVEGNMFYESLIVYLIVFAYMLFLLRSQDTPTQPHPQADQFGGPLCPAGRGAPGSRGRFLRFFFWPPNAI